jgi:hypothetical protein
MDLIIVPRASSSTVARTGCAPSKAAKAQTVRDGSKVLSKDPIFLLRVMGSLE